MAYTAHCIILEYAKTHDLFVVADTQRYWLNRQEFREILDKLPSDLAAKAYGFTIRDDFRQQKLFTNAFCELTEEEVKVMGQFHIMGFDNVAKDTDGTEKQLLFEIREELYRHKAPRHTENNILVSACIPTHNGAGTIEDTLTHLDDAFGALPQDAIKEVLICLDNCTDGTSAVVDAYTFYSQSVLKKIVHKTGSPGKATSLNILFAKSKGEYLYLLDDDVQTQQDGLARMLNILNIYPSVKITYAGWHTLPLQSMNPWKRLIYWVFSMKYDTNIYGDSSYTLRGGGIILRRSDYCKLPEDVINDDEFLGYIYKDRFKQAPEVFIGIRSVQSIKDYYRRYKRITQGNLEMPNYVSKKSLRGNSQDYRLSKNHIKKLGPRQKLRFICYRTIRTFVKQIAKYNMNTPAFAWDRIKYVQVSRRPEL